MGFCLLFARPWSGGRPTALLSISTPIRWGLYKNFNMAIFEVDNGIAKRIRLSEFAIEKDLQRLIENNLETIFNCRFVATEFSTGNIHSGRIDTLAISEDLNLVIIEYKKIASSDLINQSFIIYIG